ncbi:MAG: SAM-dependent methyltransferase [Myxococcales bacterium]|nr:SAM-dependent methyltransferase [Myxococcales bacterium]
MPTRTVFCADALQWLSSREVLSGCSLITSLPDVSELPRPSLQEWRDFFLEAATLILTRCPPEGVAIFFQSDIRQGGEWIDKGQLVSRAAESVGALTLWHKVVCRVPPGSVTFGRAGYSHLLCFSRGVRLDLRRSSADVIPDGGRILWTRGMGVEVCRLACRFALEATSTRTVVDPFCGRGTVLAAANALGLDAIGVEFSRKRCRQARALVIEP